MPIQPRRDLKLALPILFLLVSCTPSAGQDDRQRESLWVRTVVAAVQDPGGLAAGDLDGDGHPDIVVAAGAGQIMVLLGDGAGGLQPRGRTAAGSGPVHFALADLDEDGDLDVAVANHETEYVTVLLGDGAGGLAEAQGSPLRLDIDPHPHVVAAADIDLDGHVDLLVDDRNREAVRLLRGRGDGTFEVPGTRIPVGGDPYRGLPLGDLNGDGRPDLVTPNSNEAAVLLNRAEGGLQPIGAVPATAPFGIALADLDGDGALDLVTSSESGALDLFRGHGDGSFERMGEPRRLTSGGKRIRAADFNGDGIDDVAIANYMSPEIVVLLGSADGITEVRAAAGEHPWGLAAADLDGDGRDDLIVGDEGTDQLYILLSRLPERP